MLFFEIFKTIGTLLVDVEVVVVAVVLVVVVVVVIIFGFISVKARAAIRVIATMAHMQIARSIILLRRRFFFE